MASGSYTLVFEGSRKGAGKRTGSAVTDGCLGGETGHGSCGGKKIGQIAEVSKDKGVHPLRGEL